MCKIISVISCKGGVGKTTSAVNISAYLKMQEKRVCAVDLDAQHNLSRHFGVHPLPSSDKPTITDLFLGAIDDYEDETMERLVHESICRTNTVDVIPSTVRLSSLETVLSTATSREHLLEYILSFIKKDYDYIFLDCHPGLDISTLNALTASDSVLIPVEAHILGSDGLKQVEKMIRTVQHKLNPRLQIEGIIITKYQGHTGCCRQVYDIVKRDFGSHIHIFEEPVKYAIKVAEAPAFGVSLHEYAPNIEPAQAYARIALEVMKGA